MSDANRDTMHEGMIFIRGTYERDRAQTHAALDAANAQIAALTAERDSLQIGYDQRGSTIDGMEEDFMETHAAWEIAIAERDALAKEAYDLSAYAAAINWDGSPNTPEWFDGLRRRIERVQLRRVSYGEG